MTTVRVAIASFTQMPPEFRDDEQLAHALRAYGNVAAIEPWDDPDVDWDPFDAVVIRSTWNYARRRDDFLAWCERRGPVRPRDATSVRPPQRAKSARPRRWLGAPSLLARTVPATATAEGPAPQWFGPAPGHREG